MVGLAASRVFSDYRNFDGWLMPTSDVQSNAKGSAATITSSVTYEDIPDDRFVLPDAIKALESVTRNGTLHNVLLLVDRPQRAWVVAEARVHAEVPYLLVDVSWPENLDEGVFADEQGL